MPTITTKYSDFGQAETDFLSHADPVLGEAIQRLGKVERVIMPDLFTVLIHAIVGQLISAKAAHTIWERMQERLGAITPANLAEQQAETIQSCEQFNAYCHRYSPHGSVASIYLWRLSFE
nr:hypothetical protein [Paenibacillus sinopodophylli]